MGFLLPPTLAPENDTEAAVAAAAEVANAAAAQAAAATTAAAEAAAAAATAAAAVAVAAAVDTNADAVAAVGAAAEAAAEATTGVDVGTAAAAVAVHAGAGATAQAAGSAEDVRDQVQALVQDVNHIPGTQTNPVTNADGVQESVKEVSFPTAGGALEQRVTVLTKTGPQVIATAVDKTGSSVLTETDTTTVIMTVQSDAGGTMVDVENRSRQ